MVLESTVVKTAAVVLLDHTEMHLVQNNSPKGSQFPCQWPSGPGLQDGKSNPAGRNTWGQVMKVVSC